MVLVVRCCLRLFTGSHVRQASLASNMRRGATKSNGRVACLPDKSNRSIPRIVAVRQRAISTADQGGLRRSSVVSFPGSKVMSTSLRLRSSQQNSSNDTPHSAIHIFSQRTPTTYPRDALLFFSHSHSHHLGKNAGGIQKGVYLARRGDLINSDTGKPFAAGDFLIGSVARLPSVSLKVRSFQARSRGKR